MYGDKFKQATKSLMSYCREQMGYDKDPDVHYVTDNNNANNMLGYTAHYQPDKKIVTVYISNRHPKDALRSLSHELVHHAQNCRGDLQSAKTEEGYAQNDPHMRKMEEEAYLQGNMMFRDWEDSCKEQNMILPSTIGEQKMSNLKNLIKEKIMEGLLAEKKKMPMGPGPDGKKGTDDDRPAFLDQSKKDPSKKGGKIPKQLEKHVKASQGEKEEKVEEEIEKVEENANALLGGAVSKFLKNTRAKRGVGFRAQDMFSALKRDGVKGAMQYVLANMDNVENSDPAFSELGSDLAFIMNPEMNVGEPTEIMGVREQEIEEVYKNPDRRGAGGQDIDAGIGKSAHGNMGDAHNKKVAAARNKKSADRDAADRERLNRMASTGEGGWYKVGSKKKKKVKENELTDIKKGQDSINKLNEHRNKRLNAELMRRLLK